MYLCEYVVNAFSTFSSISASREDNQTRNVINAPAEHRKPSISHL